MSQVRDPRLVEIPDSHVEAVAELVRTHGIVEAIRLSGLGRNALLSVIARRRGMAGTAALVREFMARGTAA